MIRLDCDYTEGAHERIMAALAATNREQCPGYGEDGHCAAAREQIMALCQAPGAQVHFLVGGTQANATVIAAALRPYQGVLCPESGHIACHETGAIEASGHKVLPLPQREGKISAAQVREAYQTHWNDATHEHLVQPGMVYISQPTEGGTLYAPEELEELYAVCRELRLPLYVDGARLGYALAADKRLSLAHLAANCDAFTIGGTKQGLLFGEAVVITDPLLQRDFRYMIKRGGGMLAKGRLLGVQFEEAFRDGLYFDMAANAVAQSRRIRAALAQAGIPVLYESPTNQLFPILTRAQQQRLAESFVLAYWQPVDEQHDAWRICCSWATGDEAVDELIRLIGTLDAGSGETCAVEQLRACEDPRLLPLLEFLQKGGAVSVSAWQRELHLGYAAAARRMELLRECGVLARRRYRMVTGPDGKRHREELPGELAMTAGELHALIEQLK